ncbi:MAG: cytidylyltransferase domain-containing protein [Actinomycetes bacterium]
MTILAIVQARMTSTRFPGKVLSPLLGEPMILRQLERVCRARHLESLIIATSTDPSDDPLVEVLETAGYSVFRGPLDDVLARFIGAIDDFQSRTGCMVDVVVRLTADCPLASPEVIDEVIDVFQSSAADYVSNTMTPTFPDGLDVEVIKVEVLREVASVAIDPPEREHVTLGVYRRNRTYAIGNYSDSRNNSDLRWTVDTPEDLAFVSQVYEALYPNDCEFEYQDVLDYLQNYPERSRTIRDAARNAALKEIDTGAMNA